MSGPVRVGVDVVAVAEVADSVERFGERYLRRVYTDHERASCAGAPEGLAARFAAKEATLKVLRPTGARPEWRSIEVVRGPEGACDLRLHGTAARLADESRLGALAVSLTHDAGVAAAVVVALCEDMSLCEDASPNPREKSTR